MNLLIKLKFFYGGDIMKIAVATDDGKMLRFGHFGDAKKYMIYSYRDGVLVFEEERENPYLEIEGDDHNHNDEKKSRLIRNFLSDVEVFVGHSMGVRNRERLEKQGIKMVPLLKKGITVEEALHLALSKIGID